ncbi:MAG: hypothetical protein ACM3VZ_08575 [Acidobacteriota bacterium]
MSTLKLAPASQALLERSLAPPNPWNSIVPGSDIGTQLAHYLLHIQSLAAQLAKSPPLTFDLVHDDQSRLSMKSNATGNQLFALMNDQLHAVRCNYPNHRFDPRIDLVMDALTEIAELSYGCSSQLDYLQLLNEKTKRLQSCLKRKPFLEKVRRHKLEASQRAHTLRRHFDKQLAIHGPARLHRLEFSYVQGQHRGYEPGKQMHEQVRSDWRALESLLAQIFEGLLFGYAWKLDYTTSQGYRYFVALLLSPTLAGAVPEVATIRQRWCSDITGSSGVLTDDQTAQHLLLCRYRRSISHPWQTIEEVRAQIADTALFLSQPDAIVEFHPKGNCKTYGYG